MTDKFTSLGMHSLSSLYVSVSCLSFQDAWYHYLRRAPTDDYIALARIHSHRLRCSLIVRNLAISMAATTETDHFLNSDSLCREYCYFRWAMVLLLGLGC